MTDGLKVDIDAGSFIRCCQFWCMMTLLSITSQRNLIMDQKMYINTFTAKQSVSNNELNYFIKEWPQIFGHLNSGERMGIIREMRSTNGYVLQTDHGLEGWDSFQTDYFEVKSILNPEWEGYEWEIKERERTLKVKNRAFEIDQILDKAVNGDTLAAIEFCKIYHSGELNFSGPTA